MEIKCPFCKSLQKQKAIKSWAYGKLIKEKFVGGTSMGASITCSRYLCKCGKSFNFYETQNNKTWTNPKPKE